MKEWHSVVQLIPKNECHQLQAGKHAFINLLFFTNTSHHYLYIFSAVHWLLRLVFFVYTLRIPPCGSLLCDIPFVGSAPLNSIFSLPPAVRLVFVHCKFTGRIWWTAFCQCSEEKQKQLLHGATYQQHPSTPCFPSSLLLPPSVNQLSAMHQHRPPSPLLPNQLSTPNALSINQLSTHPQTSFYISLQS